MITSRKVTVCAHVLLRPILTRAFTSSVPLSNCVSKPSSYQIVQQISDIFNSYVWTNCPMTDNGGEVEQPFREMAWEDLVSTLETAIIDVERDTSVLAPLLPPPVPAGTEPNILLQLLESSSWGYVCYNPLVAAPLASTLLMAPPGQNTGQTAPVVFPGPLYGKKNMSSCHQWQWLASLSTSCWLLHVYSSYLIRPWLPFLPSVRNTHL